MDLDIRLAMNMSPGSIYPPLFFWKYSFISS